MNATEFIEKLEDRYGEPKNRAVTADILDYFDRNSNVNFDQLYTVIGQNYEYESFPNLAKIKKLFDDHGVRKEQRFDDLQVKRKQYFEKTTKWSSEQIALHCSTLRVESLRRSLNLVETDFLYWWGDLHHHWQRLQDNGKTKFEIQSYCDAVKRSIANGEKFQDEEPDKNMNFQRVGRIATFAEVSSFGI
jgi:hypothetical protein